MQKNIDKRIIYILGALCFIFFIGWIGSCSNAHRHKVSRDRELELRLELEERISKSAQLNLERDNQLTEAIKQLEELQTVHTEIEKALNRESDVSLEDLKEDIEKIKDSEDTMR
ncbi:hypothetical protein ACFLZ3_03895 [Candidatus Omnitrophota bacterium]